MAEGEGGDAADRVIDLYRRHARAWDEGRGRELEEKGWVERFLDAVRPGGVVLDLGCGGGEPMARALIERGFGVTGVDASAELIEVCRRRFPDEEWLEADMRRLALGETFAGILAWDSLFHLTPSDQRGMFEVFRSHAEPGASLMFTSGPEFGESIGTFHGEPLYHASLSGEEYRERLAGAGFDVVRHVVEDPECGMHTVWLARMRV